MKLSHIQAIGIKQVKDTMKNKPVLIQFVMFPIMCIILTLSTSDMELPHNMFVYLFSSMYTAMAPLLVVSTLISEDKEKGCLRMLRMSNVTPLEYLLGIGAYVFLLCFLGVCLMGVLGKLSFSSYMTFLALHSSALLISLLLGALIGILSANQTAASGLSVPAMLVCSFIPMLSMFNDSIRHYGQFLFSQQVYEQIQGLGTALSMKSVIIITANFFALLIIYLAVYRKHPLL